MPRPARSQTCPVSISGQMRGAAPTTEPGKRPWETSKTGYVNWAVDQLMQRAKEKAKGEAGEGAAFAEGSSAVGATAAMAYDVGRAEDVKAILGQIVGEGADVPAHGGQGKAVDSMDTTPG